MEQSSFPTKVTTPFASGAGTNYIRTVPVPSQGASSGQASYTDGFPPLTFQPTTSGGSPPDGRDMNGILNAITALLQQYCAGMVPVYDASFASSVGGYPNGAVVQDGSGVQWVSTADNNTTTPGASGANWRTNGEGRLLSVTNYTSNQNYTPSTQARLILVEIVGGGGAGGGAYGTTNSSNPCACGSAGAAGGYALVRFDLTQITLSNVALVIGTGGQCTVGIAGGGGSYSGFGNYITANGGGGGNTTGSMAAGKAVWTAQSQGGTVTFGSTPAGMTVLDAIKGANGMSAFIIAQSNGTDISVPVPPVGPDSKFGTGGGNGTNTTSSSQTGEAARGFGAGGGGMATTAAGSSAGGSGAPGLIRIWEYA